MFNLICRWWIHFQKWLSRSSSAPASRRHCVHRSSAVRWKYVIHHRQYQWLLSEQGIHIHGGSMWPKRHNSKFDILHKYTRIKDSINFWVEKKKIDTHMNKVNCYSICRMCAIDLGCMVTFDFLGDCSFRNDILGSIV